MDDFTLLMSTSLFLQTAVQMGTHILFSVLGGIVCEKVGNMNLGIEGMMLLGAAVGFYTAMATANPLAAVLMAGLAGAFGALIYGVICITLRGNQVVTGLILTIFGTGVSGFMSKYVAGKALPEAVAAAFRPVVVPGLSKLPIVGPALFSQSPYVIAAIVAAIILHVYFNFTQAGLNARAIGENPGAADAAGVNVTLYKYIHVTIGGFLCGLGGAYLSLVFVPRWQENITAGAGWIAVAFVIFSTWSPLKAIFAAYAFGMLRGAVFKFQNLHIPSLGINITANPQILDMSAYIVTILVLIFTTLRKKKEYQSPAGLGVPYFREER
jgi:simple sugar transport system permease protein